MLCFPVHGYLTHKRDDEITVTVASAGPYANHLHLTPDR